MPDHTQPLRLPRKGKNTRAHSRLVAPMALLIAVNSVLVFYVYDPKSAAGFSSLVALILLAMTGALVLRNVLESWDGGLRLNIGRPLAVYSFFFFLYYVLTCYLYLFSSFNDYGNMLQIISLILVGYLAFWQGIRTSGAEARNRDNKSRLGLKETKALLIVSYFGTAMVVLHYAWLAAQGAYNTHAAYYEQPATLTGALWNVFAGSFEYPLVLVLGFLRDVGDPSMAGQARKFFKVYLVGILCVYITSGQFRPALTVVVFALLSLRRDAEIVLRIRHIVLVAFLGVIAFLVIQSARAIAPEGEIADADNQVLTSTKDTISSVLPALKEARSEIYDAVVYRATLSVQFLSNIIDAVHNGRSHTYGALTGWTIFALTPRLLWPDKPPIVSTQILIERYLNLTEIDNSPNPIIYFYTEFGWTGVILGYFGFGLLLGFWTNHTVSSNSVFVWLLLFWGWSAFAIVETDLIDGILLAIRQVVVVYLLYWLSLRVVSSGRTPSQGLSAAKVAD